MPHDANRAIKPWVATINNITTSTQAQDMLCYHYLFLLKIILCIVTMMRLDLRVTWVCIYDLSWHQNDLKVD